MFKSRPTRTFNKINNKVNIKYQMAYKQTSVVNTNRRETKRKERKTKEHETSENNSKKEGGRCKEKMRCNKNMQSKHRVFLLLLFFEKKVKKKKLKCPKTWNKKDKKKKNVRVKVRLLHGQQSGGGLGARATSRVKGPAFLESVK